MNGILDVLDDISPVLLQMRLQRFVHAAWRYLGR
jgi:hypothetical protein